MVSSRFLIQIVFAAVMVLLFQNCTSGARFATNGASESDTGPKAASGNGSGYGGKPEGSFHHFVPDYSCENQETSTGNIKVSGTGIDYTRNLTLQCGAMSYPIPANLVDSSPFHQRLIGYEDKIFDRNEKILPPIPDNLVEAWCFNSDSVKTIELIHEYNPVLQRAQTVNYLDQGGGTFTQIGFQNSRLVGADWVEFRAADYYLKVDKRRLAAFPGQYVGTLKANLQGKAFDIEMTCRLGGYLDARLWPAKVLVDGSVREFSFDSTQARLFTAIEKITASATRYSFLAEKTMASGAERVVTSLASAAVNTQGAMTLKLNPSENRLLYLLDDLLPDSFRLHSFDLVARTNVALTPGTGSLVRPVSKEYLFSPSGNSVYYSDSSHDTSASGLNNMHWLRTVPLAGGPISVITAGLDPSISVGISFFKVSTTTGKLVYAMYTDPTSDWPDMYSANLDGSGAVKLSPNFNNMYHSSDRPVEIIGANGEMVAYEAFKYDPNGIFNQTLVVSNLDGSGSVDLDAGIRVQTAKDYVVSPARTYIYVQDSRIFDLNRAGRLITVGTWLKRETPVLYRPTFGANSSTLFSDTADNRFVVINTQTGVAVEPCSLTGTISAFTQGPLGELIVVEDAGAQLRVHRSMGGVCTVVNEVPVQVQHSRRKWASLTLSPDASQLLWVGDLGNDGFKELVWIALNGRPPVLVSAPATRSGDISSALFTRDSRAIIFHGNQIEPGEKQLLKWNLP